MLPYLDIHSPTILISSARLWILYLEVTKCDLEGTQLHLTCVDEYKHSHGKSQEVYEVRACGHRYASNAIWYLWWL